MTDVPSGYVRVRHAGATAVVRSDLAEAVHRALATGTLYEFAASQPGRRELQGRGAAYAIALDEAVRVVVRHNRHGGLLAGVTGDRFFTPTKAHRELATAIRLSDAGVPTPAVVAIVRYPAGGPFERADVATVEVPDSFDLAQVLTRQPALHVGAARATAQLLASLTRAGARHADLNIKNVLLEPRDEEFRAYVLDVDRVTFDTPGSEKVAARNWARFVRSARKWRVLIGTAVVEEWLIAVRRSGISQQ